VQQSRDEARDSANHDAAELFHERACRPGIRRADAIRLLRRAVALKPSEARFVQELRALESAPAFTFPRVAKSIRARFHLASQLGRHVWAQLLLLVALMPLAARVGRVARESTALVGWLACSTKGVLTLASRRCSNLLRDAAYRVLEAAGLAREPRRTRSSATTNPDVQRVLEGVSHNDALGVPMGASADEVRRAFRRLAKACHPDRCEDPRAEEAFKKLRAAYDVLINRATR
jgi:hypothetical protein